MRPNGTEETSRFGHVKCVELFQRVAECRILLGSGVSAVCVRLWLLFFCTQVLRYLWYIPPLPSNLKSGNGGGRGLSGRVFSG